MDTHQLEKELLKLEKIATDIIRRSIRDSSSDYHVQIGISSLDPGVVKYSMNIQNLDGNFAPITLIFKDFDSLKEGASQLNEKIDRDAIEKAFLKSRVDIYRKQLEAAEKDLAELEEIGYDALVELKNKEYEAKYSKKENENE